MMSARLTNVQTPHMTSNTRRKPSSPSKAPKEQRSTEHRPSSLFARHFSDNSSLTSPSSSDLGSDVESVSGTKNVSRGTTSKRWTASSVTSKSSSTSSSKGSGKKTKGSATLS